MKIAELRRENLRALIEKHGGVSRLAEKLGYASPSFLVQQAGPNPTREVTEKSVRKFERALGLPEGYLDRPPEAQEQAPTGPASPEVIGDVIRLVGALMQNESIPVPSAQRFTDVIALAVMDTLEHGGVPREGHIRQVVRLLKA